MAKAAWAFGRSEERGEFIKSFSRFFILFVVSSWKRGSQMLRKRTTGVPSAREVPTRAASRHAKKNVKGTFPSFSSEMTDEQIRLGSEIVLKALTGEDAAWDRRVAALHALCEALKVAGAAARHGIFLTVFGSAQLKQIIMSQLQDLRSGVVRCACDYVTLCSSACIGDVERFRCTCECYLPVLLPLCIASASVVSSSADKAVSAMIETTVVSRSVVQTLVAACRSRSAPMRDRAFRYIAAVLCQGDQQVLLKQLDSMLDIVRDGVADAAETSRKYARVCFWALHALDEARCNTLLDTLPDHQRDKIEQDKELFVEFRKEFQSKLPQHAFLATTSNGNGSSNEQPQTDKLREEDRPKTPRGTATPTKRLDAVAHRPSTPRGNRSHGPGQQRPVTPAYQNSITGAERWHIITDQVQSTEWSARVAGLTSVSELLMNAPNPPSNEGAAVSKAQAAEIARFLPYRIDDPHYRVCVVALDCLDGLLANAPLAVLNELPHLLSAVFSATQGKEVVRRAAHRELEVIASVFDVDILLAPLYRVVDVANQHVRVKQACFEYLLHLVQKQPKLITATLLRSTLAKLMQLHAREAKRPKTGSSVGHGTAPMAAGFEIHVASTLVATGPLADIIAGCIASLYEANTEGFIRAVLLLPPSEQEALFVMTEALLPHLKQDVRRTAAGERLIPHAASVPIVSPFGKECNERSPTSGAAQHRRHVHTPARTSPEPAVVARPRNLATELSFSEEGPMPAGGQAKKAHYDPSAFSVTAAHQADVVLNNNTTPAKRSGAEQRLTPESVSARIARTLQRQPPDVLVLLRSSHDPESRRSALLLASVAVTERPNIWRDAFCEMMAIVMSLSSDGDHSVRVAACRCMVACVSQCEGLVPLCVNVLSMLVECALTCMEDPFPEVQREASVLFHLICAGDFFSVCDVVRALLQYITARSACTPSFIQALEQIGCTIWRHVEHTPASRGSTASMLWLPSSVMEPLMEKLVKLFSHELSEVRKSVVGVLVHIWASVDERVLQPLETLSLSQRKLVSIYYHRHAVDSRLVAPGSEQRDLGAEIDARRSTHLA